MHGGNGFILVIRPACSVIHMDTIVARPLIQLIASIFLSGFSATEQYNLLGCYF